MLFWIYVLLIDLQQDVVLITNLNPNFVTRCLSHYWLCLADLTASACHSHNKSRSYVYHNLWKGGYWFAQVLSHLYGIYKNVYFVNCSIKCMKVYNIKGLLLLWFRVKCGRILIFTYIYETKLAINICSVVDLSRS